nr:hypothetical protein [Tanacetum cinerariifolium]
MGSLLPQEGNEIENRAQAFRNSSRSSGRSNSKHLIDRDIMNEVKDVLDTSSDLVKTFRMARDRYNEDNEQNIRIKLIAKRGRDGRTYNLLTFNEVAGLLVGDFDTCIEQRDIMIEKHREGLERINIFHPLYLPLQYPLLMPCGQDGGRLFQQFLVDGYMMVETERLYFHRAKQSKLRCDTYLNIRSSIAAGNTDPIVLGKLVVLSSSFTGGPRYMRQNYMDAMALCRWYCCPNLFITITCNPNWHEIARYMREHNLTSTDHPNVLLRVFKMKLDHLMKVVKELCLFRRVQVAEIPDPNDDPDLYKLVLDFMMRGLYGEDDPSRACEQQVLYDKNSDLETFLHKPSVGYSMFEGDAFYCRMLLNSAKGCRTHDEIKKVNGVVYPTYKEACYAAGLLEDDKETSLASLDQPWDSIDE